MKGVATRPPIWILSKDAVPRMPQTHSAAPAPRFVPDGKPLPEQIAESIGSRSTPLSQLLRLMAALEAEGGDAVLRLQLRARIGAPLDA